MIEGRKPFSASAVRSRLTGETPRALGLEEIPQVQEKFAEAAVRAKEAGFDAVEILASAGYLISQFLAPITNLREDAYGGPLENRMRFGIEVVEKVRSAVGPSFPVLMRVAGNDFMEGGHTNRESRIFAAEAEKAGVDLLNVTGGWHETRVPQLTMSVPRQAYVYLAQGIKSAVSVPVLASNRINDPAVGEEIVRNGQADLVTMARGLLTDPDLPKKAKEGRSHLIYHCIACNQGCFDRIFQLQPATCLVNPRAGREGELKSVPVGKPKQVLVIGGGPAGMKAACTAAERGHRVTLVEKGEALGGQLLLNRRIPGRQELITAAADLARNLQELDVDIRTGTTASPRLVKELAPDTVVVATGATPGLPPIPGIDADHVVHAWDLLAGNVPVGSKVVIVGGNAVGLETAMYLASIGTLQPDALHFLVANRAESEQTLRELVNRGIKEVTVLEMIKKAGQDIGLTTRWTILGELKRLGVVIRTGARVTGITSEGVEADTETGSELVPCDTVVIATGSSPDDRLAGELEPLVPEIHVIGDAKAPRNALDAIQEGFEVGRKI
jgi:2,4-dienoyl-CoA reductase (NADPH2)